jgi:hypothetical protein
MEGDILKAFNDGKEAGKIEANIEFMKVLEVEKQESFEDGRLSAQTEFEKILKIEKERSYNEGVNKASDYYMEHLTTIPRP